MTTSPLMTAAEVANYTRLSVETLRYFRQRDEGPPFAKLGRRVMYRRLDVDAWIESSVVITR
jgi:predicted DNA-binding transcriptional regulator AlpA